MSYSKLALGCMRLSKLSLEEAEELILCAVENGIKLFDHADIYGRRECERLFGEVLKRNPNIREKIIIQSKCGICKGYYDLSKEYIISQVEESVKLLNCGYLDILLHTGRHHQIRVQFSNMGNPLYGDKLYGGKGETHMHLHAYYLSFIHPVTKEPMRFKVLPKGNLWDKFDVSNL